MKKTEKTALTAAVFAAALNLVPGGTEKPQTVQAADSVPVNTDVYPVYGTVPAWETTPATEPVETDMYAVYGPAPAWTTTPATTETEPLETVMYPVYGPAPSWTTAPAATETEPVDTEIYPVYGPAPAWNNNPLPQYADINNDGRIDTYDYLLLRKIIAEKGDAWYYDLNGDGESNIADLVRLQKYLLGGDEPYVTTTEQPMYGVYGPPTAFERNTVTTAVREVPEE